jgi:phytoene dehydrogenase-like protein
MAESWPPPASTTALIVWRTVKAWRQNFMFRPFPGMSRYATPVKRLYLIGASTWPGGGVNGLSGDHVARRLIRGGRSARSQARSGRP